MLKARLILGHALLAASMLFIGCAGVQSVPFQPEKTRVKISSTPAIVADILATDFLVPAINMARELGGQTRIPGTLPQVMKELGSEQKMTIDGSAIHLRVTSTTGNGGATYFDFPYVYQNGVVSLVCNGYGIDFGTQKAVASVRPDQNMESKIQQILLGIKAKAESGKALPESAK